MPRSPIPEPVDDEPIRRAYAKCAAQFAVTRKHLPDCPTLLKRRATLAAKRGSPEELKS